MYYVHEPTEPYDSTCHADSNIVGGPFRCIGPRYQIHLVWADSTHTCICWKACQAHLGYALLYMGYEVDNEVDIITVTPIPQV